MNPSMLRDYSHRPATRPTPACTPEALVASLLAGEESALELLYEALQSFKSIFRRHLGSDQSDDLYHDLILTLGSQIRRGCLQDPSRLWGYARIIVLRQIAAVLAGQARERGCAVPERVQDTRQSLESQAILAQQQEIARRILAAMPKRDREVLERFYIHEERPESIQRELGLTPTQFRLIKSRAKARFYDLCQKGLRKKPPARAKTAEGPFAVASNHTALRMRSPATVA